MLRLIAEQADVTLITVFVDNPFEGKIFQYGNYGAERMAYGTDYPLWDPVTEVKRFQEQNLTASQFDQIAHKTAERILKL